MEPITQKQIQLIKIAQKQIGLDDGTYRDMLKVRFRVSSCTKLSYGQASLLIDHFKKSGFRIQRKAKPKARVPNGPRRGANVVRLASRAEIEKINALSGLIEWRLEDGLHRWIRKRFRIEQVRTADQAYRVIEGLKKMFENRMKKEFGEDWWVLDFADRPAVQVYIDEHCPAAYR